MAEGKQHTPLLDIESVLGMLNKISLLAGLSEKQLYSVLRLLEVVGYKKGEYVFEQGSDPSYIYIIRSGRVKLFINKHDTTLELIVFGEGQSLGEASVIGIRPHSASAIAIEDCELIVLSRKALMSIYESDKEIFSILILNIAREVCRRLHAASETLLYYKLEK